MADINRDWWDAKAAAQMLDASPPPPSNDETTIINECRSRWQMYEASRQEFLRQRRSDREFIRCQYSPEDLQNRGAVQDSSGKTLPPRPSPEMHMIESRSEETIRQFRQSRTGFKLKSSTSGTASYTADCLDGLARRDQLQCNASAAYDQSLHEADLYGEGWLRVEIVPRSEVMRIAQTANPGMAIFDKVVKISAVEFNDNIAYDTYDTTPDTRDKTWLIELVNTTIEARNAKYPKARKIPASTFSVNGDPVARDNFWFPEPEGEGSSGTNLRDQPCRIAHYYRTIYTEAQWGWVPGWDNPVLMSEATEEQLAQIEAAGDTAAIEGVLLPYTERFVLDGHTILEGPTRVVGGKIPYTRIVSQRYVLPDQQITYRGRVFMLRDPSAAMSYTVADMLWKQMLGVADGVVADSESISGFPEWDDPLRPWTVKRFRSYSTTPGPGGEPISLPPPSFQSHAADLSNHAAVAGMFRDMMGAIDGQADSSARELTGQNRSADALDRMDQMAKGSRSTPLQNIEYALGYLGELWLAAAREVYSRVGRREEIDDGTLQDKYAPVLIGVPFIRPDDGEPVPVPGIPEHVKSVPHPEAQDRTTKVYRFDPTKDAVMVETYTDEVSAVGREASVDVMLQLMGALPPEVAQFLVKPILKTARGRYPAIDDAVESLDNVIPDGTDSESDVKTLSAELSQAKQQLEQAMAENEQMKSDLAAAKAVTDSQERQAQIRAESAAQVATIKAESDQQKTMIVEANKTDLQDDKQKADVLIEGIKAGTQAAADVARAVAEDGDNNG